MIGRWARTIASRLGGGTSTYGARRPAWRTRTTRRLRTERLEPRELLAAEPLITELMASNGETLLDLDGDTPDWFEVHNPIDQPASLLGYSVTDDPDEPDKWQFSDVVLDPGEYLVVFASGKDRGGSNIRVRVTRDFITTPDGTFLVDLPEGTYDVRMTMGDSERIRDDVVISVQGAVVDTITTQPGEILVKSYSADVDATSGGQLALRLADTGGQTGRGVLNGLVVTPSGGGESWRFDFGPAGSPVDPGYRAVTIADTYMSAVGYGWMAGTVLGEQDRGGTDGEQHTNFKLGAGGEYLALISPEGVVVSEYGPIGSDYPQQFTDISYGITETTPDGEAHYFLKPTPGRANEADSMALGFVQDTTISEDRGFYDAPFDVEIATSTPGATIVYTTNGSEPTLNHGTQVSAADPEMPPTAAIHIDGTTVLRAAAFKAGYASTNVDTQTYLFLEDIIRQDFQSTLAAGFPRTWNGTAADYGLDRDVIGQNGQDLFGGTYAQTIRDDLKSIPTLSLVMKISDMFGSKGIYANPEKRGSAWERPVSVEYFDPATGQEFQAGAGVHVVGGLSREPQYKKHGLRLVFRSRYGPPQLEFPLFGEGVAERFDAIQLRSEFTDSWTWFHPSLEHRGVGTYLRDKFVRRTQRAMGHPSPHGKYVHLYINGFYWGLYDAHERPDELFMETYFGGQEGEWDIIKHPERGSGAEFEVVTGSRESWETLMSQARQTFSAQTEADKTAVIMRLQGKHPDGTNNLAGESYLDVENYMDYLIFNMFVGNSDWGRQNFYAARRRGPDSGGFKFFAWDAEQTMGVLTSRLNSNLTFVSSGPASAHTSMRFSQEYRLMFADRIQRHFFHGGDLSPEVTIPRFEQLAELIERAIVAESARWGHLVRQVPRTRDVEWVAQVNWVVDTYLPQRPSIVLQQFREVGVFPDVDAPELAVDGQPQHGGAIRPGADITLDDRQQEGVTIYYTLSGEDPRLMGGAVSPAAVTYDPEVDPAVTLSESTQVKARVLDASGQWSALTEAVFESIPLGDLNFDGSLSLEDIDAFVLGLKSPTDYQATYAAPPSLRGDMDQDGDLDFDDIDELVELLAPRATAANARGDHGSVQPKRVRKRPSELPLEYDAIATLEHTSPTRERGTLPNVLNR